MIDRPAIRTRAALNYGVVSPGPALRRAVADVRALLAEVSRLSRRLVVIPAPKPSPATERMRAWRERRAAIAASVDRVTRRAA